MPHKRTPVFDNARTLLILLVVAGHVWEPLISKEPLARGLYSALYLFHIPAFAWLSGQLTFAKLDSKALRSLVTALLLPLLLFQVLYCLFDVWVRGQPFSWSWLYTPNWILWFLLSLFCWRLLLPLFLKLPSAFIGAVALSLLAGATSHIGYPLSLSRTFVFFPFFVAGHLWPRTQLTAAPARAWRTGAAIAFAALLVWAVTVGLKLSPPPDTRWLYGTTDYAALGVANWRGALIRLALLASAFVCVMAFFAVTPRRHILHFTERGMSSLAPFLLHGFIVRAASHFGFFTWLHARTGMHSVAVSLLLGMVLFAALSSAPIVRVTEPLWNPGRFFTKRVVQPAKP